MTASAWRSMYESHEQLIITRTGTHIRKPVTGPFDVGFRRCGAVPGILVAILASPPVSPGSTSLSWGSLDIVHLREWIGRSETRLDQVTPAPMAALAATLDIDAPYPQPGDPLPPLWHWLYFLPIHRQSELGPDGHAKRGGFLPPVPL